MSEDAIFPIEERAFGERCCAETLKLGFSEEQAREISALLRVLAHPIRLQIFDILVQNEGKVCVCDLVDALPVKQPTISHHLKLMKGAGLVDSLRDGLWIYYFIRRSGLREFRDQVAMILEILR